MSKQSFYLLLLICILLLQPLLLIAEDENTTLIGSFDHLTDQLLQSLEDVEGSPVLAVLNIRNSDGRDSALGNYLEERLVDFLMSDTGLAIVERNQIEQVLQEWEYSLSGLVKADSMSEIGNMAGADAVLLGILTRVDQSVQVNLRIIDTESALVIASIEGLLVEPQYISMYMDLFDREVLTDEDFFIGRGRDFDRDRAFLDSFVNLCRAIEKETGRQNFLDVSFVEFLEAAGNIEFTVGSRQNCIVKVRKDQLQPQHLYNFFFRDGRSRTVYYYDENNYGWRTNPFFQELVEREYDTIGVPEVYGEAAVRSEAFSTDEVYLEGPSFIPNKEEIQNLGSASTPEWALLNALIEVAHMLQTKLEVVVLGDDHGSVDFVSEYVSLEDLEWVFNNLIDKEIQISGDRYIVKVKVDVQKF